MLNKKLSPQWSHDYICTGSRKQIINLHIHYESIFHFGYKYKDKKNKDECHEIVYGFSPSPFGDCIIASTQHGICTLMFESETGKNGLIKRLKSEWPKALLKINNQESKKLAGIIFSISNETDTGSNDCHINLHIRGSEFNIKVWKALLLIPWGHLVSYQDIAMCIGHPKAARAVGTAIGKNPVSFLIPCHRVIRKSGELGNYGGGPARKKAIIGWEAGINSDN